MDITEFLGADRAAGGEWRFALGPHLHGAFGGAFGGVLAAAALLVCREQAPGREPIALDCRFLRGIPGGVSRAVPSVLHSGRTLSCVSVDMFDERERLGTRATVSLVDRDVLVDVRRRAAGPPASWTPFDDARPWPPVAPIVDALAARTVGSGPWGVASAIRVPWHEADHSAEATCLAADLCVGPPVGLDMSGESVSTPNPDLSLRFCGTVGAPHVVGVGRMERAGGGIAAVRIEVWSQEEFVAFGASASLLLPAP